MDCGPEGAAVRGSPQLKGGGLPLARGARGVLRLKEASTVVSGRAPGGAR